MTMERFDAETEGALRDTAPDPLAPIDEHAPVSGHVPAPIASYSPAAAPEHDWASASDHVYPVLRPGGTQGLSLADVHPDHLASEGLKKHALPLIDPGPAGLAIAYVLREPAFDVLVNADHLLGWGITPETMRDQAIANLRSWSESAPWTDELQGDRHLLSSDTGEGSDAARILLGEVREHLAGECGGPARTLIALPDRDLLVCGSLNPGDRDFASQLAAFVSDVSEGAHEPIDGGLFEIVGDACELVRFAG